LPANRHFGTAEIDIDTKKSFGLNTSRGSGHKHLIATKNLTDQMRNLGVAPSEIGRPMSILVWDSFGTAHFGKQQAAPTVVFNQLPKGHIAQKCHRGKNQPLFYGAVPDTKRAVEDIGKLSIHI
jgi:hypothetical protein